MVVNMFRFADSLKQLNKMTFILRRRSPYVFALFPLKFFNDNKDTPDPKLVEKYSKKENTNDSPQETGKDRLKRMFYRNEYEELSPEIRYCIHISTMAIILGAVYGGTMRGRSAFIHFIDSNEATMFANHLDAKRKLQDSVTMSIFKGGIEWGWRCGFFTTIYALTSSVIGVLRGKSGILEHVDGAAIAGAIYNMKNGVRGVIVGGSLGGVLGAIFGTLFYCILLLTGQTIEEVQFWTYEWNKNRDNKIIDLNRKKRLKDDEKYILQVAEKITGKEVDLYEQNTNNFVEQNKK